jgi:Protein of unknown function (DUF1064)
MARWSTQDLARTSAKVAAGQVMPAGRAARMKGNLPQYVDGMLFDSTAEARRYQELKLLKLTGQITDLEIHKPFFLHVQGTRIGYYEADFTYLESGKLVLEDVKGYRTDLYKWKKKHVEAEYRVAIREIKV